MLYGEPAEFHKEIEGLLEQHDRAAFAAPRGHAKSSLITVAYALYRAAEFYEPYILIVSDTQGQAAEHLGNVIKELLENEKLTRDYPHLKLPESRDYRKKQVKRKQTEIITVGGIKFTAKGAGQSLRGLRHGAKRPSLIIGDDLENDEAVQSPEQRLKLENWFKKSLSNLPGASGAQIVIIGTILHRKSLLSWLLSDKGPANYAKRLYRAVKEDGLPLWPSAWTLAKLELKRLEIGSRAFSSEFLNDPVDESSTLFKEAWINANRRSINSEDLQKIAVAVDPSASGDGDLCGIVAGGTANGHGYVLEDNSLQGSPAQWARVVLDTYHRLRADYIVAEKNQGGEMILQTLKSVLKPGELLPPVVLVWASRGKQIRAEPVATLYEQGKVHHVRELAELEDEMVSWIPGMASPGRMDANVWLLQELLVEGGETLSEQDESTLQGW